MKKSMLMLSLLASASLAQATNGSETVVQAIANAAPEITTEVAKEVTSAAPKILSEVASKAPTSIFARYGKKVTEASKNAWQSTRTAVQGRWASAKTNLVKSAVWESANKRVASANQFVCEHPYQTAAITSVVVAAITSLVVWKLMHRKPATQPNDNK